MNIHQYHVTNGGECYHEDTYKDFVVESDDFTWTKSVYKVDIDLLPDCLLDDDEKVGDLILKWHYGVLENKPEWLVD